MKRKLFIGSSSKNQKVAEMIKKGIDNACSNWLEVEVWSSGSVFRPTKVTIDSLVKASHEFDYGVFVAAKDDLVWKKCKFHWITRDNVMLETGLFVGSLGLSRAFVLSCVHLPSDFDGVITIRYKGKYPKRDCIQELIAALERTRQSFPLGHRQSSALAYGYYNNFLLPTFIDYCRRNISFKMQVLIPNKVSELYNLIEKHKNSTHSEELLLGSRHLMKLPSNALDFWDIPRCLRTLESFAGFYENQTEIGNNLDWNIWLNRELDNFYDALILLVEEGALSKNIEIMRI